MKIDQSQIVAHALALLDREGLEGFNLRALASSLGVKPPALYWHVENKMALFALMAHDIYGRAMAEVPEGLDWRAWLLCFGRALRRALLSHRDAARLCAIAPPLRDAVAEAELIGQPLLEGVGARLGPIYESSVISLALGWALYEQNTDLRDYLSGFMDIASSFEIGLEAMVAGFSGKE